MIVFRLVLVVLHVPPFVYAPRFRTPHVLIRDGDLLKEENTEEETENRSC